VPYVDKVKSVKKTLGFPNQSERYGAKYENGVAYLLSYTVSVEKMWTQNTRIIHDTEVQEREPWDFYEWITCNEKPRCAPNIFPIMFWREI
jgi:hypothetical protein